jgi:hypothetical protein
MVDMDSNIGKIKELLERGYKIIEHQMKFQKKESQNILENIVTLKKESNTEVVHSINSKEFFEYIIHFKKAKDQYDNIEFVYVEDLEQYNKMAEKKQDYVILRDHHKLKISGREFYKGIITLDLKPSGPSNSIGIANFWIELDQNLDFKNVDFKDELEVYDRSNNLVFRGYVKNYESSDKTGFVSAQDTTLKMQNEKISVEFIKMHPADCLGLVTESVGLKFQPHGIPYNTIEREFIIIIPIQNLIIDQSFKIGDVEFYQKFDSADDSLIRKSDTGRTNSLWNGNFPRAKTIVKAKQFFEAFMKGYTAISKAMDIIALRIDMSFPSIKIDDDQKQFQFSYYKHLSKVRIPTWVYCREKNSQAHTFFNIESIKENVLSLEIDPQNFFKEINKICSNLIIKENPTEQENNLLQVLHWLRKSIQEGNNKDKFIYLWIAFEFLTSGTKTENMFTRDEITGLKKLIENTEFSADKKDAIKSKISMLNDSPLMVKFNHLKNSLGVDLSDWELKCLKTARDKRTDLIHGKKMWKLKMKN